MAEGGYFRSSTPVTPEPDVEVEASPGTLLLRFGARFGVAQAERLSEALAAHRPLSSVTLDFKEVRELEAAALLPLATNLNALHGTRVLLRGLTCSQTRILGLLGAGGAEPEDARGGSDQGSTR